jgi:transcription antitermination protein NusB
MLKIWKLSHLPLRLLKLDNMKSRTKARAVALQVLYEVDMTGHNPAAVMQERLENEENLTDNLHEFIREIIFGVQPICEELDIIIAEHAPEWPLDQVATIDRNIIRIALWEFAINEVVPVKVAINEAVELGKLFGSESTPRFVNGVLGSLAVHQNEIKQYYLARHPSKS